jgi:hypothetical protein
LRPNKIEIKKQDRRETLLPDATAKGREQLNSGAGEQLKNISFDKLGTGERNTPKQASGLNEIKLQK